MFFVKDLPAAPSSAPVIPVSLTVIRTLCATLIGSVGLGQHLCGLPRFDSMITTCMFSTTQGSCFFGKVILYTISLLFWPQVVSGFGGMFAYLFSPWFVVRSGL